MSMPELLEAYIKKLRDNGAVVLDTYIIENNRIDPNKFGQLNLTIPQDLIDFWQVIKGVEPDLQTTVERTWFDGTFTYFSDQESLVDYQAWREACKKNPQMNDWYMPEGFLPIGSPGDGSRILMNCRDKSPTFGQLYELFHGIGLSKLSESLVQYFRTLLLAFGDGLSIVDGVVEIHEKKFKKLAAMMNPGCSGCYDIPQVQDWLPDEGKK